MKSRPVRFGRAIALSILFFTCVISLIIGEPGVKSVWNTIHIWSGSFLILGAVIHLGTNWDWVKAASLHPTRKLKQRVRRLRRTDLWLFVSGGLCTIAGVAWMIPETTFGSASCLFGLHRLTGIIMILTMVVHLAQHWNWMVQTARWMRESQEPKAEEHLGEAQA
jgi:hypothetical protein